MADLNNPVNESCEKLSDEKLEIVSGGIDDAEAAVDGADESEKEVTNVDPGDYGKYPPHHRPWYNPDDYGQYPPHIPHTSGR